ncbi:MAG: 3'-5' exoribonuclease, partial [Moorella sp. (in: Bacteria)]|nr:3'-5' exoribonuclease [Moorella sp. (in: firmicutes)]
MLDHTYVVVDVETTGLDPASDQIIEIAAIRLEKGQLAGQWHTLVNPGRPIPPFIENLTGISNAMVQGAPPLTAVLPAFLDFLGEAIPVGHNGSFDLAFLYRALGSASWHRPLLDTLALSRILYPCLPSYRLEYLTQKFSLEAGEHHRALGDALATARLLHTLWQATLALDKGLLAGLLKLAPPGLQPWFQAALATAPVAAVPVEVAASGIFAPEEAPATAPPEPPAFCPDDIASLLEPGGLLAGQLPGYEYRPQQADILRNVAAALRDDKCLLVEAGTGTGKSLAYLLPAIYWACSQGKRVAIATHTISL